MKVLIESSARRGMWTVVGLAAGLTAASLSPVWAAALDPDSCAKLKTEQEAMEKAGLKDEVAKGPEWAKANLPAEKLNDIKRWIEVDEQLLFRCPGRHLVNLPLDPDPPSPPPQADDKKGETNKADAPAATPRPAAPAEKKAAAPEKKAPEKKPRSANPRPRKRIPQRTAAKSRRRNRRPK